MLVSMTMQEAMGALVGRENKDAQLRRVRQGSRRGGALAGMLSLSVRAAAVSGYPGVAHRARPMARVPGFAPW